MIKIVVFKGKAGSGKTTAARHIEENYGYIKLRFAYKLKEMLEVLGLSKREIDGDLKESACEVLGGKTPRHAMITLGTEWGRDMIHPDIWVKALDRDLHRDIEDGFTRFVIDDLRFLNEEKYLRSLNVSSRYPYKVIIVGIKRGDKTDTSTHISETQMDGVEVDHLICNNGTIESLYTTIDEMIEWYFGKEK